MTSEAPTNQHRDLDAILDAVEAGLATTPAPTPKIYTILDTTDADGFHGHETKDRVSIVLDHDPSRAQAEANHLNRTCGTNFRVYKLVEVATQ